MQWNAFSCLYLKINLESMTEYSHTLKSIQVKIKKKKKEKEKKSIQVTGKKKDIL